MLLAAGHGATSAVSLASCVPASWSGRVGMAYPWAWPTLSGPFAIKTMTAITHVTFKDAMHPNKP